MQLVHVNLAGNRIAVLVLSVPANSMKARLILRVGKFPNLLSKHLASGSWKRIAVSGIKGIRIVLQ